MRCDAKPQNLSSTMPHNRPPATHSALKVKFTDFELISRSRTLACEVGSRSELESVSVALLKMLFPTEEAVRLLGV